jgi:hypothetical protein
MAKLRVTRVASASLLSVLMALLFSCHAGGGPESQTPTAPPQLQVYPRQVHFFTKPGMDPQMKEFMIGVPNRVSPAWSARVDTPWLTVEPSSGRLPENAGLLLAGQELKVSVRALGLSTGTYEGTIFIDIDEKEAGKVPVHLHVTTAEVGQTFVAKVEPGSGTAWQNSVVLEGPFEVSIGSLDECVFVPVPGQTELAYDPGDMVILVKGTLANESDSDWHIDFWGMDSMPTESRSPGLGKARDSRDTLASLFRVGPERLLPFASTGPTM